MRRLLAGVTFVITHSSGKEAGVRKVGTRELKQHTGEIIERVRGGERVILTLRGEPVAVISPIDRGAVEEAVRSEAGRAERESMGWLTASEGAFSFWENEEDGVWDEVARGAEG